MFCPLKKSDSETGPPLHTYTTEGWQKDSRKERGKKVKCWKYGAVKWIPNRNSTGLFHKFTFKENPVMQ